MFLTKINILTIVTVITISLSSCALTNDIRFGYTNSIPKDSRNESELGVNENDIVCITILGKKTIMIKKDRFDDDIYGTGQLDNRLNLDEIDDILNAIKGTWQIDEICRVCLLFYLLSGIMGL